MPCTQDLAIEKTKKEMGTGSFHRGLFGTLGCGHMVVPYRLWSCGGTL